MLPPPSTCAGVCDNIRSIVVEVSAKDYFEEPDTQEAQHLFREILSTLKVCYTICHTWFVLPCDWLLN